jgi:hypothetical protein
MNQQILKIFIAVILSICFQTSYAQDTIAHPEVATVVKEKKLEVILELASRYLWRGQSWGGDYFVMQPTINYNINKKFTFGVWATTNFKNDYYDAEDNPGKGYQEIDFNLTYTVNDYLKVMISDYYWPSVEKVEGIDNSFFNYGSNGVKTVELNATLDFSKVWKPLQATVSTFIGGNDFKFDDNGENAKRNFTTYLEASYILENIGHRLPKSVFQSIDVAATVGAVLNNQAQYYPAGDYDKVSFINFSTKLTKNFECSKSVSIPISLNYIHNGAKQNTEFYGRNFWIVGVSFQYN